jgi:pyruvate dehydrogenase E1 component beta subunit
VGNTATGLLDRFGPERIIDTPVSENAVTGAAVGAGLTGMRPIVVHPRMDFMFYAFDPIINQAANWRYMCGGGASVPLVVWGIINRGGEQAAQHSQALHAIYAHIPGLKVVMPSNPYDAKGLMISAIKDDNPVVFIDDRWLHETEGHVPEEIYDVSIGEAAVRDEGKDITIFTISYATHLALKAGAILSEIGIEAEIIDLRSVKPMNKDLIVKSVSKTGHALVLDIGWQTCGLSAEICAVINELAFSYLKVPIRRLALPDVPAPASIPLEKAYYLSPKRIVQAAQEMLEQ